MFIAYYFIVLKLFNSIVSQENDIFWFL